MVHGKFPTSSMRHQSTHVGDTYGPKPMHEEDFQALHNEEEQMEMSALFLAPFITWHVAEDASQITLAWQMLTGF